MDDAESHSLLLGLMLFKNTVVLLSVGDDVSPGTLLRACLLSSSGGQSIFLLSPLLVS